MSWRVSRRDLGCQLVAAGVLAAARARAAAAVRFAAMALAAAAVRFAATVLAAATALGAVSSHAQVVLDNFTPGNFADDMGANFDGDINTFLITEDVGRRAGANLFHSFSAFSLEAGQTALFSSELSTDNVVSRVTGGVAGRVASVIHGTISSTISSETGNAAFWFVNPAGVIFGANAAIDVGGTFNAGAADFIAFPDDLHYSAFDGSIELSVASPAAFGFLDTGGGPGVLRLGPDPANPAYDPNDPGVSFAPGDSVYEGLSLAGRTLTVTNSVVGSESGLGAQGSIALAAETLSVTNSLLYADTAGALDAGIIEISGGVLRIDGATLRSASSDAAATGAAGVISIDGSQSVDILDSDFDTSTIAAAGSGNFGWIIVASEGALRVSRSDFDATSLGAGDAGVITLVGRAIEVDASSISSESEAATAGLPGRIDIDGVESVALSEVFLTTQSFSDAFALGEDLPGEIVIRSDGAIELRDTVVTADTLGDGSAGQIDLDADTVLLERTELSSGSTPV
ncbi:MAG TPA: filamentous hemagglutinin N-terminal domain-containing protein, partial [Gammaproteobacteria bacterium]|nr:filamentous hemagglutinin N-terminal domain-containing protein [Gammaproteobacteria bacterium]